MDSKNRARKAREALGLIEDALAMLEEASHEDRSESGDDLFWAFDRYSEAHLKACETDLWNDRNERIPSPVAAIRAAIKQLEG